jgi:GTP-binding protein
MDARHPLTPLDDQLLDWFLPTGKPVHILLTKSDKLSRQQATTQLATVRSALEARGQGLSAQLFSSLKRTGVDEVEAVLLRWLELGAEKEAPPVVGD